MTTRRAAMVVSLVLGLVACGGGGGGKSAPVLSATATGGRGSAGAGGYGGYVYFYSDAGDVQVSATPDLTGMPSWTYVAPELGDNPRTVATSVTLTPDEAGVLLGDDDETAATALVVKVGVTLTLGETSSGEVALALAGPLVVDGTVRADLAEGVGPSRASVRGSAAAVYVSKKGRIETRGADGDATTDGGDGGDLDLTVSGHVFVEGAIDGRGGKGMNGGEGGYLNLEVASGWVVVTGTADSSGGEGLAGQGGAGGGTEIWGRWSANGTGNAYGSGSMIARGGQGTAGGGAGGDVYFSSCKNGWTVWSGAQDASGGDARAEGPGGDAASAYVEASGGKFWVSGSLLSRGGAGAGAGAGGAGDYVGVSSNASSGRPDEVLGGHVAVQADASGGDGATGGDGGEVEFRVERSENVDPDPLHVAIPGADASGGAGTTEGGSGGDVRARSYLVSVNGPDVPLLGEVTVSVTLRACGGAASAGAGGTGGELQVDGDTVKAAALTADAGASTGTPGQGGGTIRVNGASAPSTLGAALSVKGGAGTAAGEPGSVTVDGVMKDLVGGVYQP